MHLHVSSTVVLIIRRSKLYYTSSGIVIHIGRWPSGAQVEERPVSTCTPDGHLQCVTIPDAI